jgi:dipeptidyl aminopeptidase/acylaminoacyl peptidase
VLKASSQIEEEVRPYLSRARRLTFRTTEGAQAHAWYYPPTNPAFSAPAGDKPPLLLHTHGGPTGAASSALDWRIQYFTSRGFAVVDVNHRGSTGYGRDYRLSLYGNWGVMDVDDCANAVRHLVLEGLVDARRLAARGDSAGAFTTLSLLAFRDILHCGVSYAGISDLLSLASQTANFEAHYLDQLLGPLPEWEQTLKDRSPLLHADEVRCPILFVQGREDEIVPPAQMEEMVNRLRAHGVPVAELLLEGEQHGLRQAASIRRALEAELSFYAQVLGLRPVDTLEPVRLRPPLSEQGSR